MNFRFSELLFSHSVACGSARYDDEYPGDPHQARVVIWGRFERGLEFPLLLDTGAPWCIVDPALLTHLAVSDLGLIRRLIVRGESVEGRIARLPLTLRADEGEDFTFETSVFLPLLYPGESWPYPNFLGLSNGLDRLRITLDPGENAFYFGPTGRSTP